MKNVNFVVPKDVQRILSSHTISEKFNEQEVFYKKISQYSQQNTCARVSFIKKSQFYYSNVNFVRKRLQRSCFLDNIAKLLRRAI